jgi:hypothetical protein
LVKDGLVIDRTRLERLCPTIRELSGKYRNYKDLAARDGRANISTRWPILLWSILDEVVRSPIQPQARRMLMIASEPRRPTTRAGTPDSPLSPERIAAVVHAAAAAVRTDRTRLMDVVQAIQYHLGHIPKAVQQARSPVV